MRLSRPHAPASAGNDAPCIDERAATRGRISTECGDAHAGSKSASSVRAPAWRTFTAKRRDQGRARWLVHPAAFVAGSDAPLIGERAATRRRIATEGGDAHAGMKREAQRGGRRRCARRCESAAFAFKPRERDLTSGTSKRVWRQLERRERVRETDQLAPRMRTALLDGTGQAFRVAPPYTTA
jgi:hypothetical protein